MEPGIARGLDAFNARQFFEAHELWEDVWMETVGPERRLIQGLIQIAAAYLKAESGNHAATIKLLVKGLANLRQFPSRALGLDLAPFLEDVAADLTNAQTASPSSFTTQTLRMPKLRPLPTGPNVAGV